MTLPDFNCDTLPAFYGAAEVAAARNAAAELTRDYRLRRRAAKRAAEHKLHVGNAAKHLESLPQEGESIHCVMRGNYHAWDLVPAVLRLAAPATIDYLGVATLGFNRSNAAELLELFDAGQIARVDFICSCYFRSTSRRNTHSAGWVYQNATGPPLPPRGRRDTACRAFFASSVDFLNATTTTLCPRRPESLARL